MLTMYVMGVVLLVMIWAIVWMVVNDRLWEYEGPAMLLVTLTMCLGTLFSFQAWDMFISIPVKIESYERYQAHHTIMVSDEIDFPTTQAKVDWNQWLYNAQSSRNLLGSWSLYPEKVLNLEPLE